MTKETMVLHNDYRNGKIYSQVLDYVVIGEAIKATKYMTDKHVIRAVRKTFKGKILKNRNIEITLTIGRPNFLEREFIKKCKKANEPFPIKKIQLKLLKK